MLFYRTNELCHLCFAPQHREGLFGSRIVVVPHLCTEQVNKQPLEDPPAFQRRGSYHAIAIVLFTSKTLTTGLSQKAFCRMCLDFVVVPLVFRADTADDAIAKQRTSRNHSRWLPRLLDSDRTRRFPRQAVVDPNQERQPRAFNRLPGNLRTTTRKCPSRRTRCSLNTTITRPFNPPRKT